MINANSQKGNQIGGGYLQTIESEEVANTENGDNISQFGN
jgi:hypothetical protein